MHIYTYCRLSTLKKTATSCKPAREKTVATALPNTNSATMSTKQNHLFRALLLAESALNIASMIPLIASPETNLAYIVKNTAQMTELANSLMQVWNVVLVLSTVPLLVAYPEPTGNQPSSVVIARRRLAYLTLGGGELILAVVLAREFMAGNSGFNDTFLIGGATMMTALVGFRAFFLYIRPDFMGAGSEIKDRMTHRGFRSSTRGLPGRP